MKNPIIYTTMIFAGIIILGCDQNHVKQEVSSPENTYITLDQVPNFEMIYSSEKDTTSLIEYVSCWNEYNLYRTSDLDTFDSETVKINSTLDIINKPKFRIYELNRKCQNEKDQFLINRGVHKGHLMFNTAYDHEVIFINAYVDLHIILNTEKVQYSTFYEPIVSTFEVINSNFTQVAKIFTFDHHSIVEIIPYESKNCRKLIAYRFEFEENLNSFTVSEIFDILNNYSGEKIKVTTDNDDDFNCKYLWRDIKGTMMWGDVDEGGLIRSSQNPTDE